MLLRRDYQIGFHFLHAMQEANRWLSHCKICLQVFYKLTAQVHADLVNMRVQLHTFFCIKASLFSAISSIGSAHCKNRSVALTKIGYSVAASLQNNVLTSIGWSLYSSQISAHVYWIEEAIYRPQKGVKIWLRLHWCGFLNFNTHLWPLLLSSQKFESYSILPMFMNTFFCSEVAAKVTLMGLKQPFRFWSVVVATETVSGHQQIIYVG